MNITELDEWQGITADMVREWLKRTGWELRTDEWGEKRWFNGNGRSIADKRVLVTDGFRWIASQSVQKVQALLREINPRMREWPSREAVASHNGLWVARRGASPAILCTIREDGWMHTGHPTYAPWITKDDLSNAKEWRFWPCDEHGSKVRWPTDAQGNML